MEDRTIDLVLSLKEIRENIKEIKRRSISNRKTYLKFSFDNLSIFYLGGDVCINSKRLYKIIHYEIK